MIRLEAMAKEFLAKEGFEGYNIARLGTDLFLVEEYGKPVVVIKNSIPKRLTKKEREIIFNLIKEFVHKNKENLNKYKKLSNEFNKLQRQFDNFVKKHNLNRNRSHFQEPPYIQIDFGYISFIGDKYVFETTGRQVLTKKELQSIILELDKNEKIMKEAYKLKKEKERIENQIEQIKYLHQVIL